MDVVRITAVWKFSNRNAINRVICGADFKEVHRSAKTSVRVPHGTVLRPSNSPCWSTRVRCIFCMPHQHLHRLSQAMDGIHEGISKAHAANGLSWQNSTSGTEL